MPQPIDMQTELGRTLMAQRIQEASTRAALLAQQRQQQEEQQLRGVQESQVAETPEAQSEHVDEDGHHGNPGGDRDRRRAEDSADERASTHHPKRRGARPGDDHAFDVSV